MPTLSARFQLKITSPCLLSWPENENPIVKVCCDEFEVVATLLWAGHGRVKLACDTNWTTELDELDIVVSHFEHDSPPAVVVRADGERDLTFRGDYLRAKLPGFQNAAHETANRILRFFRFSLFTPLVRPIEAWTHSLDNPIWIGADGLELRSGTHFYRRSRTPGLDGELGAKKLSPAELPKLLSFVRSPTEATLALELLSDAQSAWFEGNLRRCILELAICTEVMVKRTYFAKASPAGSAFDYLEDKGKISVRVLELLDPIAREAFSTSYKDQVPANYQNIDYLFRCRNKVAHRGELSFRNDAGESIEVRLLVADLRAGIVTVPKSPSTH